MNKSDDRNFDITNKVFKVLNEVKGFYVVMTNPRNGVIITRYKGKNFYINIEPIFNDNEEGEKYENKSFEEVVKTNTCIFDAVISPEEVKDFSSALYQVNQLTKVMSLFSTELTNYKDDTIMTGLDESYEIKPTSNKFHANFDFILKKLKNMKMNRLKKLLKLIHEYSNKKIKRR